MESSWIQDPFVVVVYSTRRNILSVQFNSKSGKRLLTWAFWKGINTSQLSKKPFSVHKEGVKVLNALVFYSQTAISIVAGFIACRRPKRIRTAFTPTQLLHLESAFDKNHYIVGSERKQLASFLNLSETQIKVRPQQYWYCFNILASER